MPFRAVASEFEEHDDPGRGARETLLLNAAGKAREVAARAGIPPDGAVLGADTGVVVDGRTLGKPHDADDARAMLDRLAGREHQVLTALCLITPQDEVVECDEATVRMRDLPPRAREWYVGLGEWRDRAGGYAVQGSGAALVDRIEGDYTTVVGLPVGRLVSLLASAGLAPWSDPPDSRRP